MSLCDLEELFIFLSFVFSCGELDGMVCGILVASKSLWQAVPATLLPFSKHRARALGRPCARCYEEHSEPREGHCLRPLVYVIVRFLRVTLTGPQVPRCLRDCYSGCFYKSVFGDSHS